MRPARPFYTSQCRARQALFKLNGPRKVNDDKKKPSLYRTKPARIAHRNVSRYSKLTGMLFSCEPHAIYQHRAQNAECITNMLAKSQDPASFQVTDLTLGTIMGHNKISYPTEPALIVRVLLYSPPSLSPAWSPTQGFLKRYMHTSPVLLKKKKATPPITPPEPVLPQEQQDESDVWGLSPPSPATSFWRPGHLREPLTLPENSGSTHSLAMPSLATNSVRPVRKTRAGIAYKTGSRGYQSLVDPPRNKPPDPSSIELDPAVIATRKQTLDAVEEAIQAAWGPEYTVELFGSTRYGISKANSDLDMVILDPNYPYGVVAPGYEWNPRDLPPIHSVRNIAKVLRKAGFHIADTVTDANVPIVKFADKKTHHFVDLNVNDRLGVMNSELIKRYCELNPVLRPMIQYIKQWAKPLGLNRSSFNLKHPSNNFLAKPITFSSYALVMMTIGFLQSRGLLPNLQEGLPPMEPGTLKGTFWLRKPRITCCDVRYNMAEGWTPPEDVPVSQLIQDWFRLWGHEFKFEEQMVSVRDGGILPRPTLADGVAPYNGVLWNLDPFIRRKNITGIISHPSLARFKFMCSEYAENMAFEEGRLPPPLTRTREEPPHIALKEKQPELPHTPDPEWHPVDSNELPFTWRR
ncbi:hypothetical protein R3P38DRAFT_2686481 [Favolaschia claudopus]|uniref:polynucleotide adenylyltransferase n=1 Tax=Favolaschia claudopus TaxID=2862362 RepID=A0AAW0DCD6_9AGAR